MTIEQDSRHSSNASKMQLSHMVLRADGSCPGLGGAPRIALWAVARPRWPKHLAGDVCAEQEKSAREAMATSHPISPPPTPNSSLRFTRPMVERVQSIGMWSCVERLTRLQGSEISYCTRIVNERPCSARVVAAMTSGCVGRACGYMAAGGILGPACKAAQRGLASWTPHGMSGGHALEPHHSSCLMDASSCACLGPQRPHHER